MKPGGVVRNLFAAPKMREPFPFGCGCGDDCALFSEIADASPRAVTADRLAKFQRCAHSPLHGLTPPLGQCDPPMRSGPQAAHRGSTFTDANGASDCYSPAAGNDLPAGADFIDSCGKAGDVSAPPTLHLHRKARKYFAIPGLALLFGCALTKPRRPVRLESFVADHLRRHLPSVPSFVVNPQ